MKKNNGKAQTQVSKQVIKDFRGGVVNTVTEAARRPSLWRKKSPDFLTKK